MKKLIIIGICGIVLVAALIIMGAARDKGSENFGAELVRPSKDTNASVDSSEGVSEDNSVLEGSETEAASEAVSYKEAEILRVTSFTSVVDAGDEVTLALTGKPNERYDIYVYYSKNPASDDDLEPKMSDGEGNITWRWAVPSSVKAGMREIVIVGGGEMLTIYLDIQ